jgi:prenyltransferase beta subunit
VGLKALTVAAAAIAVLTSPWQPAVAGSQSAEGAAAQFLLAQQRPDGSFAEADTPPGPALTAWTVLGLAAAGAKLDPAAGNYLAAHEQELEAATDVELVAMAERALGLPADRLLDRIRSLARRSGAIGPSINSTIWGMLALRTAELPLSQRTVRWLLAHQTRSGGWSWGQTVAPDSNDTAAALQALRAAGVAGAPIRRGLAYLRGLQATSGGFALTPGREPDAQSTAWAIQGLTAAGADPGPRAFRFLASLRRPDGSYRYSVRYATTPVWVTAQVLAALARRPFPLR